MRHYNRNYLSFLIAGLLFFLSAASFVSGSVPVEEISLDPAGEAYEINRDSQGWLWLTDFEAREVWAFNPAGNTYVIYPVGGAPSDARRVGTDLWWVDGKSGEIGRASTLTGAYTRWVGPAGKGLFGTAVDASGRLWASGADPGFVYRLDPAGPTLCSYAIPDDGDAGYLISDGGINIWFGDINNSRLMRMNSNNGLVTWWSLTDESHPFRFPNSLARDSEGHIWYADNITGELAQFNDTTEKLSIYRIPGGGSPWMLATSGEFVWFTEQKNRTAGLLNQNTAAIYDEKDLTAAPADTIIPTCSETTVAEGGNFPWPLASHSMITAAVEYPVKSSEFGWKIFQLPTGGSPEANPWGITTQGGYSWIVDYGRQKLLKVSESIAYEPALTLNKDAKTLAYDSVGDVIQYEYLLSNSGNVTLTGPFTVTDNRAAAVCPSTTTLAVGQSITCTASYSITQADLDAGSVTNTASGHAWYIGNPVDSADDFVTVTAVQSPALTLVKKANPLTYQSAGEVISYSYALSNSGNVTLTGPFTVTDNRAAAVCPSAASLSAGQTLICTAGYTVTADDIQAGYVTNSATGHAFFNASPIHSFTVYATVTQGDAKFSVFLPLIKR